MNIGSPGPDLFDALDLARLVPPAYAAYRPLVTDALLCFLERLSPRRREAILAEQLGMPQVASLADRLVALMRQCPTLHKLGQVVARDRRLAPDLRARLQRLESLPPPTAISDVLAIIRRELGAHGDLEVASQAVAEASVAVVVPFTWREPGSVRPRQGIFKVLKPGVEGCLAEELEIWPALGTFLEERCAHHGLPVLDYGDTLESVRRLLLNEVRLDLEQAHLAQAGEFYADSPAVLIPRLLPFCTPRMTAMDRVHGSKVTDADAAQGQRLRLAETMVEALVGKPFWSEAASAVFHADPHAGNLFVASDGQLAILDWSLVTRLGKAQREDVLQSMLGALTLDEARICGAIAALGRRPPDERALRAAVGDALRQVRRGVFPGFEWLMGLLDRLAASAILGFPEELVLFRKAVLSLSGVVADVSECCSIDRVLIDAGLTQFLRELAGRALAPAGSRAFGSHVSNADLFGVWASWPVTAAKFWIGSWQDTLETLLTAARGEAPKE